MERPHLFTLGDNNKIAKVYIYEIIKSSPPELLGQFYNRYNHNFAQMYSLIWTCFSGERYGRWASCQRSDKWKESRSTRISYRNDLYLTFYHDKNKSFTKVHNFLKNSFPYEMENMKYSIRGISWDFCQENFAFKIWRKTLICHYIYYFKSNNSYFKNIFVKMHLKPGINIYLLASK